MPTSNGLISAPSKERLKRLFADKEIFFRSHGKMHFVRISSRVQVATATLFGTLFAAWLIAMMVMLWNQMAVAHDRADVDAKARSVAAQINRVNAYKRSVGDIAAELDRRQDALDDMVRSQFGAAGNTPAVVGAPDEKTRQKETDKKAEADKLSRAGPAVETLRRMEQRQRQFAVRLASLINQRAAKAEAAIRSFGLNPKQIAARSANIGQGGPYIPWSGEERSEDPAFAKLANAFVRLNALERGLLSIPSSRPTASPMLTSSYGYRRDPFNGHAAFHAGVDFPGAYRQPILAASAGRVSYVGQRQGYGNVVEIDHGHGIMTRYAHLSGFTVRPGQNVTRGFVVGRMGSTGRSTGTHLHFEVRLNGAPINPRRFLEVKEDVLKVQQIAKQRVANVHRTAGQSDERS